jgi:hypothetical protein
MADQFVCYAEHHEDLTEEVRRQVKARDNHVVAVRGFSGFGRSKPKRWAVIVYCNETTRTFSKARASHETRPTAIRRR